MLRFRASAIWKKPAMAIALFLRRGVRRYRFSEAASFRIGYAFALAHHRPPVIQHQDVARQRLRAKRDRLAVAPYLGADRLAGKHRGGKAEMHFLEPCRIVVATGAEDRATSHSKSAKPMQDR